MGLDTSGNLGGMLQVWALNSVSEPGVFATLLFSSEPKRVDPLSGSPVQYPVVIYRVPN